VRRLEAAKPQQHELETRSLDIFNASIELVEVERALRRLDLLPCHATEDSVDVGFDEFRPLFSHELCRRQR